MTYARPLLATDLSEGSADAARLAPHLLGPDARGVGIFVLGEPDLPRRAERAIREELQDAIDVRARDALPAVAEWLAANDLRGWEALVPYGPVASTVSEEADGINADVILLGSTGKDRVQRALLGSVARAVLHRAHADVLIARPREPGPLRSILVATDLHPPSVLAAKRALAIAEKNDAALVLLHALDPGIWSTAMRPAAPTGPLEEGWLEKAAAGSLARFNAEHLRGRATEILARGRAAGIVSAKARELGADLVVTGTNSGNAISRAMLGSVADPVAERSPCSVLVVRR